MHRAVPALVGVLVATLLSSCTDGADAGPDGSADSSSGPATSATAPTDTTPASTGSSTRPPPEPPAMPALAREKSTAGAKAFVKYYIDILNYSWTAGTGRWIRTHSTSNCQFCMGLARFIEATYSRGGWQRGGDWRASLVAMVPGQSDFRPILIPAIHVSGGAWKKSRSDKRRIIEPHQINYEFSLVWRADRWLVQKVAP